VSTCPFCCHVQTGQMLPKAVFLFFFYSFHFKFIIAMFMLPLSLAIMDLTSCPRFCTLSHARLQQHARYA
jgi:hypothetical protein